MDRLELNIHPSFIIFAFVLVYLGHTLIFVNYLTALVMHELAHYYVAKSYGYNYSKIIFMPYGLQLSAGSMSIPVRHEVIIAIAGPLCNLVVCMILLSIWWCWPLTYNYTYTLALCNFYLCITNMIPIVPLDGGRLIVSLLSTKVNRYYLTRLFKCIGVVAGIILMVISVILTKNITMFIMSFFLISSAVFKDASVYYDRCKAVNKSGVLPIKAYVVDASTSPYSLIKYFNSNSYCVFYLYNGTRIVGQITEDQIIKSINKR